MQKTIILTGSNGLLGQKIVHMLAKRSNIRFVATSRGTNKHPIREGYIYESADITDKNRWSVLFAKYKPTELIHGAAMTQVDKCEEERTLCDSINTEATAYLATLCKQYGTKLILISTDFIFSGAEGPYKENDAPAPVNYYGLSKVKAEQAVIETGCSYVILRTALLYGVTPSMSRSNIVLWVKKSLEQGKAIRVVDDQERTPTLAEDLASASITVAMRKVEGIFHISGSETYSILEIAYKVAEFWKLDKSLISRTDSESLGQRAKRPLITGFIILKAQTELNYKPHTLEQGLVLVEQQLKKWG